MKCRPNKCKGACCYNVPFKDEELEKYKDKIINPVLAVETLPNMKVQAVVPFTVEVKRPEDIMKNKCPFLRHDCTCNIYENRPEICRLFGEIAELPCKYRKQ